MGETVTPICAARFKLTDGAGGRDDYRISQMGKRRIAYRVSAAGTADVQAQELCSPAGGDEGTDKSWSAHRQAFGKIKRNKHDVWIVLYPEGTRSTPQKLLEVRCSLIFGSSPTHFYGIQSQAFARQKGKKELRTLLFPRTKGFISTIQGWSTQGELRALSLPE